MESKLEISAKLHEMYFELIHLKYQVNKDEQHAKEFAALDEIKDAVFSVYYNLNKELEIEALAAAKERDAF